MEDGKFDGVFMTIVQQNRGIEGFFDEVFGFLRRKTDFFKDQKQGETVIVKQCSKHFLQYQNEQKEHQKKEDEKKQRELERQQKQQKEQQKDKEEIKQVKKEEKKIEEVVEQKIEEEKKDGEKEEYKGQIPIGCGGKTDLYNWNQTLEEVQVYITVEDNVKGKDCQVDLTTDTINVKIKGNIYMKGKLPKKINAEDSLWTIETNEGKKQIHITLDKWKTEWTWWDCVIEGHEKIDTSKINPEPSNLSDLEGETKATVEKMMFDMRQKQMGKPSSDELKKQEMLSKFMKEHPEMDFSKCKFS